MQIFQKWIPHSCATFFGIGLIPFAPGTFGTLAAIPLSYFSNQLATPQQVLIWVFIFGLGTWSAKKFAENTQTRDSGQIVIDEVLGFGIAALIAQTPLDYVLAFLLFRFFDILKIPPVRILDRWSKKQTGWKAGLGVMIDDIGAGIQALILLFLFQQGGLG